MAGDWIKMRLSLQTHPKVVRILSATKSDKFRVVGGLHAVWGVFDTHSEDGKLEGYCPETLDHIIGWDGFSDALISVGWMEYNGESLILPEFSEHNGKSGKRRAEDQKRKRDDRKSPQPVRNMSDEDADENGTREEKRREDNNNNNNTQRPDGGLFPDVPGQIISDFKALRNKHKAPITKTAMDGIAREANKAGISLADALKMCCERGWRGFKAEWVGVTSSAVPTGGSTDPRFKGAK